MKIRSSTTLVLATALAALALIAAPARGAVGVEAVSRHAAPAGATVELTLGCGFCFPPCHGPHGQPDTTCMPGTMALPPPSFPVSLVPVARVPEPYPCHANALCGPLAPGAPRNAPFSFLGRAGGPAYVKHPGGGRFPRYSLSFAVPDRRPGLYAYVIFCDVCQRGGSGSLIAAPAMRNWRLRILPRTG